MVGQEYVFSHGEEVFLQFTKSGINAKQIERICHHLGEELIKEDEAKIANQESKQYSAKESKERHYVSVDGAMFYTRTSGWKEIKLGRIYKQKDIQKLSPTRKELRASQYAAHLGNVHDFIPKVDYYIENLNNKIFIADGAKWIWNWVEDSYPESIQIVDYYHAKEHLCEFAQELYPRDKSAKNKWIDIQEKKMKEQGINPVISALKKIEIQEPHLAKTKERLINYYEQNRKRMQYHTFIKEGLLIGSGAIESAHRNVLQCRLKRSGQRWTEEGLQQMAHLRATYKSGNENRINDIIQKKAA